MAGAFSATATCRSAARRVSRMLFFFMSPGLASLLDEEDADCLDDDLDLVALLQLHVVGGLDGHDARHLGGGDVELDVAHDPALLDLRHGAQDLVARADLHESSPSARIIPSLAGREPALPVLGVVEELTREP